jgi:hypothetical protein
MSEIELNASPWKRELSSKLIRAALPLPSKPKVSIPEMTRVIYRFLIFPSQLDNIVRLKKYNTGFSAKTVPSV